MIAHPTAARQQEMEQPERTLAEQADPVPALKKQSRFEQVIISPRNKLEAFFAVLYWTSVFGAVAVVLLWIIPRYMGKAVLDLSARIKGVLTPAQIGIVCVVAIWLLTMAFIPCQPFAWFAALVFPFGVAYLIIEIGTTLGLVCAFWLGRTVLSKPAMRLFNKYDSSKAVLMAIDRLGAFKVVLLLRFGPLPYSFVSYVSSVPDNVPFWSYFWASVLGLAPRNAAIVGLVTSFADVTQLLAGKSGNPWSLVFNLVALLVAFILVIGGTIYCRRIMDQLQLQQQQEQQEQVVTDVMVTDVIDEEAPQPRDKDSAALAVVAVDVKPDKAAIDSVDIALADATTSKDQAPETARHPAVSQLAS